MEDLRFVERTPHGLIVATDSGTQYRLLVDEAVLSEIRHIARMERADAPKIHPRDIQRLLRAGRTHEEIMLLTGADLSDISRYEGPILAEFDFILDSAHKVPVRTEDPDAEDEQVFGDVIHERLNQLGATHVTWATYKHDDQGWVVRLAFTSHLVEHQADWSFDHKKLLLSPLTPDAVKLSQQGDVGDRLIPTLRAVDLPHPTQDFDADTFEVDPRDEHTPGADETSAQVDGETSEESQAPSTPEADPLDYSRRQEIDQRAISTAEESPQDLGETADLLDALRKRRGEREQSTHPIQPEHPANGSPTGDESAAPPVAWLPRVVDAPDQEAPRTEERDNGTEDEPQGERATRKGRTAIPSWDEILFGTRGEDD